MTPREAQEKEAASADYKINILLMGDSSSGKTSLLYRFANDSFLNEKVASHSTMSKTGRLIINYKDVDIEVSDDANKISSPEKDETHAIIILFSLTDQDSFDKAKKQLAELEQSGIATPKIFLAGTRSDRPKDRKVDESAIKDFIKEAEGKIEGYMEVSAKTGENVRDLFELATKSVLKKMAPKKQLEPRDILIKDLENYIKRVEAQQKNGKIDFEHGFWHHKNSRAFNRKANYMLAKDLLDKLEKTKDPISKIFSDVNDARDNIIITKNINAGYTNRGINSATLNKIIEKAEKFSATDKTVEQKANSTLKK